MSEDRTVEIMFEPGTAEVVEADTLGYCGLGADSLGRYREADQVGVRLSAPATPPG